MSRIRPNQAAELIAQNILNPASTCCDAGANQLVIPMNANNGLAFIVMTLTLDLTTARRPASMSARPKRDGAAPREP